MVFFLLLSRFIFLFFLLKLLVQNQDYSRLDVDA